MRTSYAISSCLRGVNFSVLVYSKVLGRTRVKDIIDGKVRAPSFFTLQIFMKSKGIAYLLWFFFGLAGFHRFYVGKIFTGILYLLTFGFLGIGWFLDLFLLSGYVDTYNALYMAKMGLRNNNTNVNNNANNIVVNIPGIPTAAPAPAQQSAAPESDK